MNKGLVGCVADKKKCSIPINLKSSFGIPVAAMKLIVPWCMKATASLEYSLLRIQQWKGVCYEVLKATF